MVPEMKLHKMCEKHLTYCSAYVTSYLILLATRPARVHPVDSEDHKKYLLHVASNRHLDK